MTFQKGRPSFLDLPFREGGRPATTTTNPHQQLDQIPPFAVYKLLKERAFDFPSVERRPSIVSVPGAEALWLTEGVPTGPREAFMIEREFAHIHPAYDGSLHLVLPQRVAQDTIDKGWGELHPVAKMGLIPPTTVMIYGPRTEAEIEVVLRILAESYSFASGQTESRVAK